MSEEKVKHYEKEDLTVVWKPEKCIHAEECVKRLPQVYNPENRPWINVENASASELIDQINHCPSGALSYIDKKQSKSKNEQAVQANVLENGPIIIEGEVALAYKGNTKNHQKIALCRCGGSKNKPFCDGTHEKINFQD